MSRAIEGQLPAERFFDRSGNQVPLDADAWLSGKIHVDQSGYGYRPGWLDEAIAAIDNRNKIADVVKSPEKRNSLPWALRWSPAAAIPIVAAFGIAAGGTGEAQADGPTSTPNPNWINEGDPDETPHPIGPNEPQATPVPDQGDPAPVADTHIEEGQIIVKKFVVAPNGQESPLNQQFQLGIDRNRNNVLDPNEITDGGMTGNDGLEVISFTENGNVEGLNVCVKEINIAPELEPVPNGSTGGGTGAGCDEVDPASKIAEVILRNRNKVSPTQPPATPPPPTQPPATPRPTPKETPGPTPVRTPGPTPKVGQPPVVVVPPGPVFPPVVVQPPAGPQPPVCPGPDLATGVALPPEFIGAPAYEIEAKCQDIDHDLRQTEEHDEIKEDIAEHDQNMTEQHQDQTEILIDIENDVDTLLRRAREHAKQSSDEHKGLEEEIGKLPGLIEENGDKGIAWWEWLLIGGGAVGVGALGAGGAAVLANRLAAQRRRKQGV